MKRFTSVIRAPIIRNGNMTVDKEVPGVAE